MTLLPRARLWVQKAMGAVCVTACVCVCTCRHGVLEEAGSIPAKARQNRARGVPLSCPARPSTDGSSRGKRLFP